MCVCACLDRGPLVDGGDGGGGGVGGGGGGRVAEVVLEEDGVVEADGQVCEPSLISHFFRAVTDRSLMGNG